MLVRWLRNYWHSVLTRFFINHLLTLSYKINVVFNLFVHVHLVSVVIKCTLRNIRIRHLPHWLYGRVKIVNCFILLFRTFILINRTSSLTCGHLSNIIIIISLSTKIRWFMILVKGSQLRLQLLIVQSFWNFSASFHIPIQRLLYMVTLPHLLVLFCPVLILIEVKIPSSII